MNGRNESARIEMPAQVRFLPAAVEFAKLFYGAFPEIADNPQCLYTLQLAVSEALTNVMKHAYPPGEVGRVDLDLARHAGVAIMTVADRGLPFDPSTVPEPNLDAPAGHGLGLYFLRQLMDDVAFRREGPVNTLTLTKNLDTCEP